MNTLKDLRKSPTRTELFSWQKYADISSIWQTGVFEMTPVGWLCGRWVNMVWLVNLTILLVNTSESCAGAWVYRTKRICAKHSCLGEQTSRGFYRRPEINGTRDLQSKRLKITSSPVWQFEKVNKWLKENDKILLSINRRYKNE